MKNCKEFLIFVGVAGSTVQAGSETKNINDPLGRVGLNHRKLPKGFLFMDDFVFNETDWNTPDTYGNNFKSVPNRSGVYIITRLHYHYGLIPTGEFEILYVGSSGNLYNRYSSHALFCKLKRKFQSVQFYFRECKNYKEYEIELIKKIKPPYNKQHTGIEYRAFKIRL